MFLGRFSATEIKRFLFVIYSNFIFVRRRKARSYQFILVKLSINIMIFLAERNLHHRYTGKVNRTTVAINISKMVLDSTGGAL